ncbi:tetratricopeptide repeat protein [Bacillus tianshenii]|nr:tetratricopeptide repeat protein [Bacillus tianshenii]
MKKQGKVIPFIQDGEHFFKKGLKAYQQRDLKKARHYLLRAASMDEEEPTFLCQLAIVTAELGHYQEANEMLEKVLRELEPEMTDCYYFLANNYAYLGLFHEARMHIEAYLREAPDGEYAEDAHELLQLLQLEDSLDDETGDSLQAEEALIIRHEEAKKLLEEGKLEEAEGVLKEVIKDYPEFWAAYNNLALAYFYRGLATEAVQLTEEVLEKNEGNLHALCNMAVFCHYLGDKTKTKVFQTQLERVYPIEIEQRNKLGTTLGMLGSYAQAYRWLRSLYKKGYKGDASFFYWLAVSAYQLGNERFAEQAWSELTKLEPDKEGLKPWKDVNKVTEKVETQMYDDFYKVLYEADSDAAKYFALFALFQNGNDEAITMIKDFATAEEADHFLQTFAIALLKQGDYEHATATPEERNMITGIDIAQMLFSLIHDEVHTVQVQDLYMMCFTILANAFESNYKLTNPSAWAAAIEYLWRRESNNGKTQTEIAEYHGISVSTLSKYVKTVKTLIN